MKHNIEHKCINNIAMEMVQGRLPSGSFVHCLLVMERIEEDDASFLVLQSFNLMRKRKLTCTEPCLALLENSNAFLSGLGF
jgi:hypothetical protein